MGSGGCHAGVLACPPVFPHLLAERDLVRDAQRHIDRTPRRPRSIGHLAGYVIVDTSARTYYSLPAPYLSLPAFQEPAWVGITKNPALYGPTAVTPVSPPLPPIIMWHLSSPTCCTLLPPKDFLRTYVRTYTRPFPTGRAPCSKILGAGSIQGSFGMLRGCSTVTVWGHLSQAGYVRTY